MKFLSHFKESNLSKDPISIDKDKAYASCKEALRLSLLEKSHDLHGISDLKLAQEMAQLAIPHFTQYPLSLSERRRLLQELFFALRGYDVLQELMEDPTVTEIMVNGPEKIFYEKGGRLFPYEKQFDDRAHLTSFVNHFFASANRQLSVSHPIADLRLADGSRAHAVIAPVALEGPVLNIRKFSGIRPSAHELIKQGSLSEEARIFLEQAVREKQSIFISGGTGTGKTTLLNILSQFIPNDERVITIEDAAELQLQDLPNLIRLEARRSQRGQDSPADISALIRAALRMRPDRIIVGEVRGKESCDLLDAMNTGHPGSLSTGHGNNSLDMLRRLANLILAHSSIPYEIICQNLASGIQIMIHLERSSKGTRYIQDISELVAFQNHEFILKKKFERKGAKLYACS